MAATIKFDQTGLPAGTNNRSRSDIVAGTVVTITNVSPGSSNTCELLAKPTADNTAAISGSSPTWSITPKAGTWGSYRIRLTVDGEVVIHTFTVKSPKRSLLGFGAHNERASANANLADADPGTWVNESEANEGGHFKGWWKAVEELAGAVDDSVVVAGQIGGTPTSPDVRGVRETGDPALLTIGSIPNFSTLRRSYSQIYGDTVPPAALVETAFTQVSHGLAVGDAIYINGSGVFVKAISTAATTAAKFVVSYVYNADNFRACQVGYVNWPSHGKTVGTPYYLDASTAGAITATPPTTYPQLVLVPLNANYVFVCIGPPLSADAPTYGGIYTQDNASTTSADTTWKVMAGTTTLKTESVGFDMPQNGRLRYTGTATRKFRVLLTCTINAAGTCTAWISIGKDGTRISTLKEENYMDSARESVLVVSDIVDMNSNSYLEPMVRVASSTQTLTIENLTMTVIPIHPGGVGAAVNGATAVNGFRLSPRSGEPVPLLDVAGAGYIRMVPYTSSEISLYSGGAWKIFVTSEISLAVTGRTTDLPFDIFAYDSSGTVTLEFLDWTNATTRATDLVRQNGRLVKSGDATRLYLGTCRPRSATTYNWVTKSDGNSGPVNIDLWNQYNRVDVGFVLYDSNDSHTYTTATTRQWRASTNFQIDIVNGWPGEYFEAITSVYSYNVTAALRYSALGYDTTTTFTTGSDQMMGGNSSASQLHTAVLKNQPGIGRHFYSWNQYSVATPTTTWYGDNGTPTAFQDGVVGTWRC